MPLNPTPLSPFSSDPVCEFSNCEKSKKFIGKLLFWGEGLILLTKHHLNIILSGSKVGYYQIVYFKSD
jgi:hypothetical protein